MNFDIAIIGSGIGGLVCGAILSKEGFRVGILEKNQHIGGNLQTFSRDGHTFDTGLHYIGSMDEGQTLYRLFNYLGISEGMNLKRLDEDGYDRIGFDGDNKVYRHAMGYKAFEESLVEQFPKEKEGIRTYVRKIREVIKAIPIYDLDNAVSFSLRPEQMDACAIDFIRSVTHDLRLQQVLAGANSLYHGAIQRTPLYLHSCVRNAFVNSAFRPVDGSDQIAKALETVILQHGGSIYTEAEVIGFDFEGDKISSARMKDGRQVAAKTFISNAHPAVTLGMIAEGKIRKSYRQRIQNLENTPGFFSVYMVMKENSFPYLNYNYFHYKGDNYFRDDLPKKSWPHTYLLYTPAHSGGYEYSKTASLMTFMKYDELRKWDKIPPAERGDEYREFRDGKALQLMETAEKQFPGLQQKVEKFYVSTPLTFKDYTATKDGTAYGILKDCNNPTRSIVLPRTKIPNLMFTGQNLNIHGVLGTTMSAVITASELTGFRYLLNKIVHA